MPDGFELETGNGNTVELLPDDEVGNAYILEDKDVAEAVRLMFYTMDEKFTLSDLQTALQLLDDYRKHTDKFNKFLVGLTA